MWNYIFLLKTYFLASVILVERPKPCETQGKPWYTPLFVLYLNMKRKGSFHIISTVDWKEKCSPCFWVGGHSESEHSETTWINQWDQTPTSHPLLNPPLLPVSAASLAWFQPSPASLTDPDQGFFRMFALRCLQQAPTVRSG